MQLKIYNPDGEAGSLASLIVDGILDNLLDRAGFDELFSTITDEVYEELRAKLVELTENTIDEST